MKDLINGWIKLELYIINFGLWKILIVDILLNEMD